jgi:hypothetical protein
MRVIYEKHNKIIFHNGWYCKKIEEKIKNNNCGKKDNMIVIDTESQYSSRRAYFSLLNKKIRFIF